MVGAAVMTVAMLFAEGAVSATYNYQVTDPMVGTLLTDLNTAFWEPSIGPPGIGGASETGYASISDDGLVLGSFNVQLGQVFDGVPKWVLEGDFRVSFFLETSPNPGDYGNRLGAFIYEMEPLCGAFIYPTGYAGLWMGYSAPEPTLYYPLQYEDAAYFLFVKEENTVTIYKGDNEGVTEDPANQVFFGDYLNAAGQFLFGLGTGNPNSGWMRVRDVVIDTEVLLPCDGSTPIPPEWNTMDNDTDDDGFDNDVDNCPEVANTNQDDFDGDDVGDACDEDVDGDGVLNAADICPLHAAGCSGASRHRLCYYATLSLRRSAGNRPCVEESRRVCKVRSSEHKGIMEAGVDYPWARGNQVRAAAQSKCGK